MSWTRDGRALAYPRNLGATDSIWLQPIDGGPPAQLTAFTEQQIISFAWSHVARRLAVSRGTLASDLVMITSEEKK